MLLVGIKILFSLSCIGVGSTANCHRCCRKSDGQEFACKVIDKRQIEVKFTGLLEQFYVEIKVVNLRCDNFFSYRSLTLGLIGIKSSKYY